MNFTGVRFLRDFVLLWNAWKTSRHLISVDSIEKCACYKIHCQFSRLVVAHDGVVALMSLWEGIAQLRISLFNL